MTYFIKPFVKEKCIVSQQFFIFISRVEGGGNKQHPKFELNLFNLKPLCCIEQTQGTLESFPFMKNTNVAIGTLK